MDINNYANDLLLDFVDHFHERLRAVLEQKFGSDWLAKGVEKHFKADYFERTKRMLSSPMRVVDMEKADEDLFGVEHLGQIVLGNWDLFKDRLGDRRRTEVYLSEVAELRHNLSHRRRRHILRRRDLLRFLENCRLLLRALDSKEASRFDSLAESLSQGASPWGPELAGSLPSSHEIVHHFVGRPAEIQSLSSWLLGDSPQILIFGYGGAGKSATAFQFARQIQESGLEGLQAVCWASAKRREFLQGQERERRPDFEDVPTFAASIFETLYGAAPAEVDNESLLDELNSTPALVIVDDLDTVLDNEVLAEFLLFKLRNTKSRFVFTSRNKVPGLPTVEIHGFSTNELREFVRVQAQSLDLDVEACETRLSTIASVTGSFPLFVEDLLRYTRLTGLQRALVEWQQRRGDAARAYALRRQLEQLGGAAQDTLIGISVSSRPLTAIEISTISGSADDDVENSLRDLEAWRLIDRVASEGDAAPAFGMNANTRRLVQKTCARDERLARYSTAFNALSGQRVPLAMRHAIGSAVSVAKSLVARDDISGAISCINEAMTGDLRQSADLYGVLGWIYSRRPDKYIDNARTAFQKSHNLVSRSRDMYYHWARMEIDVAESSAYNVNDTGMLEAWRAVARIAKLGVDRCGDSRGLCQFASYAHGREGRSLEHHQQFAAAQGAYSQACAWAQRAIDAPVAGPADPPRDVTFRSLVLAQEGLADVKGMAKTLARWDRAEVQSNYLTSERERLCRRFQDLAALIEREK